ncbi:hypothetical protein D5S17_25070 [Pseudonocardiaceae bacterium YIM PH 21723]|nr:hypothetical protein D5S17_25070 [Pseudonocardiaceae bacterium YIM PH 21723]
MSMEESAARISVPRWTVFLAGNFIVGQVGALAFIFLIEMLQYYYWPDLLNPQSGARFASDESFHTAFPIGAVLFVLLILFLPFNLLMRRKMRISWGRYWGIALVLLLAPALTSYTPVSLWILSHLH